ncbi:MAG: nucleotidyl transferase AbiEii/AbiGii toxin family protein [Alphaproteobacteria bacterium]
MSLFDQLVTEALGNQPKLAPLRVVVEKELLHHDILRVLSHNNLLTNLTFIGGTCLRCCYGGIRLSEDLDFTGGNDFTRDSLSAMGQVLTENLERKYGLLVKVTEPIKDKKVDTWKIKVETRQEHKHLRVQRINIDICAVPSYQKRPMMILNPYGVDMGTSGLIIQAQSREEIYADKLIAFALRPNRIHYRDLWDIVWLHTNGIKPNFALIPDKLRDRNHTLESFLSLFNAREQSLRENRQLPLEFKQEIQRFLPVDLVNQIKEQDIWVVISHLISDARPLIVESCP